MTKKREKKNKQKIESLKFNERWRFNIIEGSADDEKRTVKVCALAPCISRNDRYYSPGIVESASGTLKGKKSFADHDARDTTHLIGKIVGESYEDGKLYADIKIGKKGLAGQMWEKIKDGIIDSVSIAADGKAKPVEMEGRTVAEVTELDIRSVDFVPEGGVIDAKVMQVFENVEDIPKTKEVKKKMIENLKQLKEEYPDLVKEAEETLKVDLDNAKTKITDTEKKLSDIKMASIKESEIGKLETTDEVKKMLKERVSGKTEDEVKSSVDKEFKYIKSVLEASKGEAKIKGVKEDKKDEKKSEFKWTSGEISKHDSIPENLKKEAIGILHYKGSKVMTEWLKEQGVEL